MDFGAATAHQPSHGLYPADLDQTFSSLQSVDTASPSHHHVSQSIPPQNFDHAEPMDVPDHPPYDIFNNNPNSFSSTRYRANSSSSPSLGPSYSIPQDPAYPRTPFSDTVPAFAHANGSSYDIMSNVPSSYSGSSGKVSPLTPSDPMTGIQHSPFPLNGHQKGFSDGHYHDLPERRISNVSGAGYHPDFADDYGMSNGAGYPPSALQPFQDRMHGRFQHDSHFPHSSLPPSSVPSHMGHSPDMFRTGVAPQATHCFRPDSGMPAYEDIPQYLGSNPHADLSLMPSFGAGFPGLRHGPGIGSSNDLQTFIR